MHPVPTASNVKGNSENWFFFLTIHWAQQWIEPAKNSAGILEQSMEGYEPSRNRVVVPACQATLAGGIDALESITGILKSLKIPALVYFFT